MLDLDACRALSCEGLLGEVGNAVYDHRETMSDEAYCTINNAMRVIHERMTRKRGPKDELSERLCYFACFENIRLIKKQATKCVRDIKRKRITQAVRRDALRHYARELNLNVDVKTFKDLKDLVPIMTTEHQFFKTYMEWRKEDASYELASLAEQQIHTVQLRQHLKEKLNL